MRIEFDPAKNSKNIRERGLPFDMVDDVDWDLTDIQRDERRNYGEERWIGKGPISGRLYVFCYTQRGEMMRVISFRKANIREIIDYERKRTPPFNK